MENMNIYEAVRKVPETAQKQIAAGRMKGKTDINPMWRIKVLTEQFGPCGIGWYYKVTNKWMERYEKECAAFVDIELFVKADDTWSMPISGTGGSMFVAMESKGPYVSDECYKMATTDAISVACKQLGIGADVYWDADKTKYTNQPVVNSAITEYKCETCGTPFTDFVYKGKNYTAKDGYEIAKKNNNGHALCNKCKKEVVK